MSSIPLMLRRMGVVCAVLAMGAIARGQGVQDQVPANTGMLIKVRNLAQTSDKAAALADRFGFTLQEPRLKDPLGMLMQASGISGGINKSGDLALAVMPDDPAQPGVRALALVPVLDYQAFLGNFPGAVTEGAITSFAAPRGGPRLFCVQRGSYAAISEIKELLSGQGLGLKIDGSSAGEVANKDVVVYVNVNLVGPQILQGFTQGLAEHGGVGKAGDEVKRALAAAVQTFLNSSKSATIGLGLNKEGIGLTALADFNGAGPLGGDIKRFKNSDAPLLGGLPEGHYLVYGGGVVDNPVFTRLVGDAVKSALGQMTGNSDAKTTDAMVDAAVGSLQSGSYALVAPNGVPGKDSLIEALWVASGDSKSTMGLGKALFTQVAGVPVGMATMKFTPDAVNLDGVSFDKFAAQFDGQPTDRRQLQAQQVMKLAYGAEGAVVLQGAVDATHVVGSVNVDPELMNQMIAAVKAGQDPMDKNAGVEAVAQNLPQKRLMVAYVAVDNVAAAGSNIFQMISGQGLGVNLPPNLPPLGMTVSSDESALRWDVYVPADLVESLVVAAMQARMNMLRGMQGGGPGL